MEVRMGRRPYSLSAPFRRLLNWDRQFLFSAAVLEDDHWFEITIAGQQYSNSAGFFRFFKFSSATYVALFGLFNGLAYLISRNPLGL